MTSTAIRQRLHNYLEIADEKKIKAIYTMIEDDVEDTLIDYTNDLKTELDKRLIDYQSGKMKMITAKDSKIRVAKLLSKKFK